MYLYDIQFQLWHSRIASTWILFRMNITETDACEFCGETETIAHALVQSEWVKKFWRDLTIRLQNLGYTDFRPEQKVLILGDSKKIRCTYNSFNWKETDLPK